MGLDMYACKTLEQITQPVDFSIDNAELIQQWRKHPYFTRMDGEALSGERWETARFQLPIRYCSRFRTWTDSKSMSN